MAVLKHWDNVWRETRCVVFRHASLVTEDQARPVTEHKDVQTVEVEQSTAWDTETDTEDDIHLTSNLSNLFPDPNDFIPSSSIFFRTESSFNQVTREQQRKKTHPFSKLSL